MSGPQHPSANSDQDFDPTADMLVNDFDDEHTLDEEEAINDDMNGDEEIDDLQKEGEMPLEELLAMYGYTDKVASSSDKSIERAEATSTTPSGESISQLTCEPNSNSTTSQLIVASHVSHLRSSQTFTHINNQNMVSDSSDDESDEDFSANEEDWRRTIQVGSDYQASIPEGLSRYDGAPAYENEDRLLWNPSFLTDKDIEEYLIKFSQTDENGEEVVSSTLLPTGSHIRDDEQALFLLHQCGHNVDEAIRRKKTQHNLPIVNESMSSWSEEECKAFEVGLRSYGKDFHLVQQNKVRTRSVGELVQFYYLWKKTERHDLFATKFRLEKKKYSLHPGTTDYMDRFLDEQENMALTNMSSSSSSLNNIQSSNKQLHQSYRSSPSTQNLSPHKSDHILMDDLSTQYPNINSLCDSGSNNSSHLSGATIGSYVNGYYKKSESSSDSVLSSVSSGGISAAKVVCHSVNSHHPTHNSHNPHLTSDWVAQQQQHSVTTASHTITTTSAQTIGSDVSSDFIRRQPISSTSSLINDSNVNSNTNTNI
ncbi:mesoderm induction early response protein 1-like isoform X2 [Oppia nitens]|uniref:mesoderm induction early response protein 1-like isoform X2 n=1 Tax=Oppia nitens TaxID=1686743 RepID=UPI0023DAE802|nr:mesoderm induction early response protein 1-like isoform X2 [Oppia nitens]